MLDIGWSEMAVIALVALLVIGPKDLPKVMRSASHWMRKARGLAREFQSGVDDIIREADLDDARKVVESARSLDVRKAIGDAVDPTGVLQDEARDFENMARDGDAPAPVDTDSHTKIATASTVDAEPNIAPPHSLTPPPPAEKPVAEAPDDGKRASPT